MNFILSNDWGGSLGYSLVHLKAKNLSELSPSDKLGTNSIDLLSMKSIRLKKVFPTLGPQVRYGIEGGFSLIEYRETQYQKDNLNPRRFNFFHSIKQTIGLSLQAKVEFPLLRTLGFEFAIISNINVLRSFIGLKLHFTIGILRASN